jgi:hypothetical protein
MGHLCECECLNLISANFNSQTTVEKVALNSLQKMVLNLPLNFSIFPKELLTSMLYMGVKVMTYSGIYGDGVKISATTGVPH